MADKEIIKNRMLKLYPLISNEDSLKSIIVGAQYFEGLGGVNMSEYWTAEKFDMRDEFFIMLNSYFGCLSFFKKLKPNNEWKQNFNASFLFPLKSNAQSAKSIDLLTSNFCYPDSFAILRTMLSRTNFLLLFSLNPNLFDIWMKNPKDEKFLDGHVRKELENNGIFTASHLYELTSEILHNQAEALLDVGYLHEDKTGLFYEVLPIKNQIFVIAKYIMALTTYSFIQTSILDYGKKTIPPELKSYEETFEKFIDSILAQSRFEHIFTSISEDRHSKKVGKNKYEMGGLYDFRKYKEILGKFHKSSGQKKKLSKKYND